MGVGDDVPGGLAQLGVDVQLLGPQELATADLSRLNAIITGTRAYAVRDDLKTAYNRRLLDYVKNGGNLIVLYNTQEFVPGDYAPYPGELPRTAEEVSEEDSPIDILAPADPVFNSPNRITKADFDGWVEQRGSKFWSTWDTALLTDDRHVGQGPATAEGRLAPRHVRQRPLHLLRLCASPSVAVRRTGRLPTAREPAVAGPGARRNSGSETGREGLREEVAFEAKALLTTTAIVEVAVGIPLVAVPAWLAPILLGATLDGSAGLVVARIAGSALVSLGVVCGRPTRLAEPTGGWDRCGDVVLQHRGRRTAGFRALLAGHVGHGLAAGGSVAHRAGGLVHRVSDGDRGLLESELLRRVDPQHRA